MSKYADGCWHNDRLKCRGNVKKRDCGARLCQLHVDLAKARGCKHCEDRKREQARVENERERVRLRSQTKTGRFR